MRAALLAAALLSASSAVAAERRLVWADEFDGVALDASKWTPAHDCWGGGNRERQCYAPANVTVANGMLRLTARAETISGPARPRGDPADRRTRAFSSGRIDSREKAAFRYGRIEVRARLPQGQGLWPALWLLPEEELYGPFPASGEIDIAEAVNLGVRCPDCADQLHAARHSSAGDETHTVPLTAAGDFHVFALDWSPHEMVWSLDGVPYYRLPGHKPFDARFHMILNLAVGGRWPESTGLKAVDAAAMPAEMLVDWVRVYARQ